MSSALDRLLRNSERTAARVDSYLAEKAEEDRREREADERNQAQIDAQTRSDMRDRFEEVFAPYGETAPAPVADESVASYHKHLLRTAQRKLSPSDARALRNGVTTVADIARAPVNEMTRSLRNALEPSFREAAELQGKEPHVSTLPPTGFVERYSVDAATGSKVTKFFGRESFIKNLSRPGRHVLGFRLGNGQLVDTTGRPIKPLEVG